MTFEKYIGDDGLTIATKLDRLAEKRNRSDPFGLGVDRFVGDAAIVYGTSV